ncbi:hypothetical protein [Thalassomonas haliotis]|uniref:Uncharacterized protein n=1 Tax=Thalassomonas haliotis TaxID=485448 RepID=A0ABY7VC06_9GAMM|nr:hypothetical protein [Thalassomonas haliotis]WDE11195.1 hypothetical protein H3N35_23655 [Thalassomonas haliotis]
MKTNVMKISAMKTKAMLFVLVIWVHITLLDLMFINHRGLVILWQENSRYQTIFTHLFIVLLTFVLYLTLVKLQQLPVFYKARAAAKAK